MKERLQKILNKAGIASRRKAEELIKSGKISVNGKIATLGDKADAEQDEIKISGKSLRYRGEEKFVYLALYKPTGYVTTRQDPLRRKTIYSLLPSEFKNTLWPIGRLDYNTEGLLVLTNDGDLTQKLSHPSFEHEKEYLAQVHMKPTPMQLARLRKGVVLGDKKTAVAEVDAQGRSLRIVIHEGRNRQIRRMLGRVGLEILSLRRTRIGKLSLPKEAKKGSFWEISPEDLL